MKKAKIFLVVQSFICILTVIMLSTAAIGVYREGSALRAEDPTAYIYTPERTASEAAPGVKVLFIGIALTICGLIFGIRDENAEKPVKDTECMRDVTCSRITEPSIEMMNERRLQDKLKKGGWLAFGVCMLPILIYIADPAHFADASHDGLEHVIGALMLHILPWIVMGTGCLIASTVQQEKSMKREINAALTELKDEKDTGTVLPVQNKISGMPEEKLNRIRIAILALAIIFIITGMANGNMQAVMVKAINICTECVGLG